MFSKSGSEGTMPSINEDENTEFKSINKTESTRLSKKSVSNDTCVDGPANREKWSSNIDFILSCVGFAVGLGNIWRFPYLCYKNGGGAFLIPYLICLVTCGVPILMLELAIGQYMSIGSVEAWTRLIPAFKGIGVASFLVTFQLNIYYIMILAWALYFLVMTFSSRLPWSHCNNDWNTKRCSSIGPGHFNITEGNVSELKDRVDAVVEFWEQKVLHISSGIDKPGSVIWELSLCLLCTWILVYFCVWRGVRWSGKVAYVTSLFPYVVLTILLVRGVTLDGAVDGIRFYLKPDLNRLKDVQVWIDAGTQIFFSYAAALGGIVTLGSYNQFKYNFYRDTFIISAVNSGTSLYGGFAVFSVLGFMAKQQNVKIEEVVASGPGLVFIAYPKAITQMAVPQLWAVLFFVMILMIGIDSQFIAVEGFIAPIIDAFPRVLYKTKNRMLLTLIYCGASFLLGIPMVTEGGIYVFQLFDYYGASGLVLLWICFFETVVAGWIFGTTRLHIAFELMIGKRVPFWFIICWKYLAPLITLGMFLFMVISFTPIKYGDYVYPRWAQGIGLSMAIISMICIPAAFIQQLITTKGSLQKRWQAMFRPRLQPHQINAPVNITEKHADCSV